MRKLDAYKLYLLLEISASLIFSTIFTVNMIYQVSVAHLSPLQLVLVGTVLETSVFLFEVPTGIVADVYSRRLSIIIGYFITGLGFFVEGSLPVFWAIALGQLLWGLGYTFTSGATQAWISDEIGEEAAGAAFLRGSQAGQLGGLLGIGASVILGNIRVNVPILVGGGLFLLLSLCLIVVMPEDGFKPTPRGERSSWQDMAHTFRSGIAMLRMRPALLTILAIGLFYGLYSEGYDRLWTKHLLDGIHLPSVGGMTPVTWFGLINAIGLLIGIVATELARRRVDTNQHQSAARALLGLSVLLVAGILIFAWTNQFYVALLAVWLVDVVRTVISPIYTAWVNQRLDSRVRATVLSMSSQVDAIGQIAGGPVVGLIGNTLSVQAALTASAMILSPVAALFIRTLRQKDTIVEPAVAPLD